MQSLILNVQNQDLTSSFTALLQAQSRLENCLREDETQLFAWFQPPESLPMPEGLSVRSQAMTFIRQLEYLDNQKPREILVGAGLIGGSEKTLTAVIALNDAKDDFKQVMLALKKAKLKHLKVEVDHLFESMLEKRPESIASSLRKVGLARLHLKQCYRRIPVFFECPLKVSWTWANTRAITRITQDEARQLLLKQGNDYPIELQLNKLAALNPNEPLAIVQELAPHLRANVVLACEKDQERRVMVKGPMPIFYLAKAGEAFPEIRPPGLKRGKNKERAVRSDVKLEAEAFLPSIRVHRYKELD